MQAPRVDDLTCGPICNRGSPGKMVPLAPFRGRQPKWHLYGATGDSERMENSPAPTAASFVPFSRNDALQQRDAVTTPPDSLRVLVKILRKTAEPIRLKYSPKWYKQWRASDLLLKPICIFLTHLIAWIRMTPRLFHMEVRYGVVVKWKLYLFYPSSVLRIDAGRPWAKRHEPYSVVHLKPVSLL